MGTQNFVVEEVIAAPALWCPNSAATSCPRVRGSSMRAMIDDGDIAVVDGTQHDGKALSGKFIVAWHRKSGLTLSRFLMMATEIGGLAGRFYGGFGNPRDRFTRFGMTHRGRVCPVKVIPALGERFKHELRRLAVIVGLGQSEISSSFFGYGAPGPGTSSVP
jgi:hypothetical protein